MRQGVTSRPDFRIPTPEEDAKIQRGIAADPDARELDDDFFDNAVSVGDFGSLEEAHAFQRRRSALSRIADDLGMDDETWFALRPNEPGFEDRFAAKLDEASEQVRAVTAEKIAAE